MPRKFSKLQLTNREIEVVNAAGTVTGVHYLEPNNSKDSYIPTISTTELVPTLGNREDSYTVRKIRAMTQSDYDGLSSVDASTLYVIIE